MRQCLAGNQILAAGVEVAFNHHAEDAFVAGRELCGDVMADIDLAFVFLARIGMRRKEE